MKKITIMSWSICLLTAMNCFVAAGDNDKARKTKGELSRDIQKECNEKVAEMRIAAASRLIPSSLTLVHTNESSERKLGEQRDGEYGSFSVRRRLVDEYTCLTKDGKHIVLPPLSIELEACQHFKDNRNWFQKFLDWSRKLKDAQIHVSEGYTIYGKPKIMIGNEPLENFVNKDRISIVGNHLEEDKIAVSEETKAKKRKLDQSINDFFEKRVVFDSQIVSARSTRPTYRQAFLRSCKNLTKGLLKRFKK